jgi:DNA polymerase epsilon subunit 1
MYPNIILTNRLQPTAIVSEDVCAGCVFNKPQNNCKRNLDWEWRGELLTLNKWEYEKVKNQLNEEEIAKGHSTDLDN